MVTYVHEKSSNPVRYEQMKLDDFYNPASYFERRMNMVIAREKRINKINTDYIETKESVMTCLNTPHSPDLTLSSIDNSALEIELFLGTEDSDPFGDNAEELIKNGVDEEAILKMQKVWLSLQR